mmetsp:Transcript_5731/g.18639  ORF Transcript_5731/g.18639 Transcript_5731/m.18639 type:complete len:282 (+) Transcript_5731:811-1656(+)
MTRGQLQNLHVVLVRHVARHAVHVVGWQLLLVGAVGPVRPRPLAHGGAPRDEDGEADAHHGTRRTGGYRSVPIAGASTLTRNVGAARRRRRSDHHARTASRRRTGAGAGAGAAVGGVAGGWNGRVATVHNVLDRLLRHGNGRLVLHDDTHNHVLRARRAGEQQAFHALTAGEVGKRVVGRRGGQAKVRAADARLARLQRVPPAKAKRALAPPYPAEPRHGVRRRSFLLLLLRRQKVKDAGAHEQANGHLVRQRRVHLARFEGSWQARRVANPPAGRTAAAC